jgi:hypothetical protein
VSSAHSLFSMSVAGWLGKPRTTAERQKTEQAVLKLMQEVLDRYAPERLIANVIEDFARLSEVKDARV